MVSRRGQAKSVRLARGGRDCVYKTLELETARNQPSPLPLLLAVTRATAQQPQLQHLYVRKWRTQASDQNKKKVHRSIHGACSASTQQHLLRLSILESRVYAERARGHLCLYNIRAK